MEAQYNLRSPAVKRLMREAQELKEATSDYFAQPLSDNLFEWHFTVRGPADTEFEGGIYHGRIILPTNYPMKPPHIIVLTPNGRFETGKKICLSISGHHPESWQPSWSIRTALVAIIGFMPTPGYGSIGSLDYPKADRIKLAKKSVSFVCDECCEDGQPTAALLKQHDPSAPSLVSEVDLKEIVMFGVKDDGDANVRKRKEASKRMQQKFREKLMARTPELVKQVEKSKPDPTPSLTESDRATASVPAPVVQQPQHQQQHAEAGGSYLIEIIVALIALVVAVILYRRFNVTEYRIGNKD